MKLIVFSDVHGNLDVFENFIKKIEKINYDKVIFLGDFLGYYYNAEEIISYARKNKFHCILGNHDMYFLHALKNKELFLDLTKKYGNSYALNQKKISKQNINFLSKLKKKLVLRSNNKKIFFCHGSPSDLVEGRIYPDDDLSIYKSFSEHYDFICTGNTHFRLKKKKFDTWFLNPGSLGQQRDGKGSSFLKINLQNNEIKFFKIKYSIEKLEKKIDIFDSGNLRLKEVLRRKVSNLD